jgi:hypothetical protein
MHFVVQIAESLHHDEAFLPGHIQKLLHLTHARVIRMISQVRRLHILFVAPR